MVFSGGASGFGNFYALDAGTNAEFSQVRMERISCLLGADLFFNSDTTGIVNVGTSNGGALVRW